MKRDGKSKTSLGLFLFVVNVQYEAKSTLMWLQGSED